MNTEQKERVFANGMFVKSQPTQYGDIIKLSIKVEDFVNFLKDNQTENGWVSVDLLQKKSIDEKGRSHTPVLNNWVPNGEGRAKQAFITSIVEDDSGLPF